ncbi:hypothetical protein JCM1841_002187 [Sporobolomyces salmonicolor]
MHTAPLSSLSIASSLACLALSSPLRTAASPAPLVHSRQPDLGPQPGVISVPIRRRNADNLKRRDVETFKKHAANMRAKYGGVAPNEFFAANSTNKGKKRAGTVSLTSYQDSEWYGEIDVGTPATPFSVVLDTGSSDLILAEADCSGCSSSTPGYTPSSSSTSATSSQSFSITYGSGSASGTLVQDTVRIANYTQTGQTFAACNTLDNIVDGTISGILGLGWSTIASSGATPLVQALAQANKLPEEVFGFAFETHTFTTASSPTAPGGTLTIGGVDTSLYSGSINWVNIVQPAGYWAIPLGGVSVGGTELGITSDQTVIDTGTTLIGVPTSTAETVYAQIPNSQAINLDGVSGYYAFPCSQDVNVALTFGNVSYPIESSQFNAGAVDSRGSLCLGAIFALETGSSSVSFIVGDAFLTGVYNAYRFSSPPAVGFATLGSGGSTTSSGSSDSTSSSSSSSTSGAGSAVAKVGVSLATLVVALVGAFMV